VIVTLGLSFDSSRSFYYQCYLLYIGGYDIHILYDSIILFWCWGLV